MNTEQYIHLFTPVSEGLPQRGDIVLIINHNGRVYLDKVLKNGINKGKWQRSSPRYWLDLSKLQRKDNISCECTLEEKHGETTIWCCNRCGKSTEKFWTNKPLT